MKLGELVTFNSHYKKSGENFDPERDGSDAAMEEGVVVRRWAEVTEEAREGIVVGKRRYASGYRFDYIECSPYERGEWKWMSSPLGKETFYLVATKMNAMFKVKPEDLALSLFEDDIEGLLDE